MKTCKTCNHWRKIRDKDCVITMGTLWPGSYGECLRIDEYSIDTSAWLTSFGESTDEITLITKTDFGCVLYKEK